MFIIKQHTRNVLLIIVYFIAQPGCINCYSHLVKLKINIAFQMNNIKQVIYVYGDKNYCLLILKKNNNLSLCTHYIEMSYAECEKIFCFCPQGEFLWSKELQGRILSGFFYGYTISQGFGGWFSDRFGGKLLFVLGNLLQSICTLFMPLAARWHPEALFVLRIVQGLVTVSGLRAAYRCGIWKHTNWL